MAEGVLVELGADQLLALAGYLDHARRRYRMPAQPALSEAFEIIDREAILFLHGERIARRRRQRMNQVRAARAAAVAEARVEIERVEADLAEQKAAAPQPAPHGCAPDEPCSCEPS